MWRSETKCEPSLEGRARISQAKNGREKELADTITVHVR